MEERCTMEDLFNAFCAGGDTLHVYHNGVLIFSSRKDRLLPLMEYLLQCNPPGRETAIVVFDVVMGNAAALLAVKAGAREVFSRLGSEPAVHTFRRYGVIHHFKAIVPFITRDDGAGMCPMEALSIDKTPDAFFAEMKKRIASGASSDP